MVAHWLTREHGRIATIAKGARRPKSAFLGRLDLFYSAEFSFNRSSRSDLHLLTEVELKDVRSALRLDFDRLSLATYYVHLIELTTEIETPIPEVAELFEQSLSSLEGAVVLSTAGFGFEVQLMSRLGVLPPAERAGLTLGSRKIWERLASLPMASNASLRLAPAQALELHAALGRLMEDQFGHLPKGRAEPNGMPP